MTKKEYILLEEKWQSLPIGEREFVVDFLKGINNNKRLNEAQWYNTLGDILGIFDPTGVVDVLNGISYILQKDYFFGFLSMVAAIPYAGDFVAKPLIGLGKRGNLMKTVNRAMELAKNGKTVEAGVILEKVSKQNKLMSNFFKSVPRWGDKIKKVIDSLPAKKLTGTVRGVIKDWVDLFSTMAKRAYSVKAVSTANLAKQLKTPMPKSMAVDLIKNLQTTLGQQGKIFRNMKFAKDAGFMSKYVWPFVTPGLLWRNRAVSAMVNRTKFYTGFLDYMGVANFVGPEELSKTMSEDEMNKKFQEYTKTQEASDNWNQDMQNLPEETNVTTQTQEPTQSMTKPVEQDFLSVLLGV